ncbi:MAG: DUF58 domain-containing protein [Spirochaetota bacterium]
MTDVSSSYLRKLKLTFSRKVNTAFIGQYKSAFRGNGLLFDTIREYEYGDDIKNLDWKVSARMNHLYVKQYQEERELNIVVMIDFSRSMDFGTGRTKRDVLMELATILLILAEQTRDRVSVIVFTDTVEWYFRPKRGRRYVLKVLNDIMHFKPAAAKTDITSAVEYASRIIKKRSVVFLISDFLDNSYETSLRRFSRKHDLIPVTISDPAEHEIAFFGLASFYDMESGETVFSTKTWHDSTSIAGITGDPLYLSTVEPVDTRLLAYFKKRNRRRLHA